ncbi:hypothetical protein EJ08DRAFT_682408 [Tothia fuscella]|uniref:ACB domain-containing protein n=1 Tax=Tothia fuscella TaxID=1048955 RepID=A0A9P4NJ88_9PEZI|nr:hypothetical protein EJ08DRAFT_682408 [Tothia fuscella]
MSDSVDRVFSHALNTVNKIRTGAEKPPASVRLKLYGLYKQSMEGDVEGIMERPTGNDDSAKRAREKWDAWKEQSGLSRTEAKRRYITTLISTMRKYASPSPDARELVTELEFVWDQVKSNVPSSSSSSPLRTMGLPNDYRSHGSHGSGSPPKFPSFTSKPRERTEPQKERDADGLHILSPMSQNQEEEVEEDEAEEFVDAPDSQIAEPPPRNNRVSLMSQESDISQNSRSIAGPGEERPKTRRKSSGLSRSSNDDKWRKRIESSLIKMTAEVAALREQLETRRLFAHTLRFRVFRFLSKFVWGIVKHLAMDVFLLGLVLLWLRRKKDQRFEGAIRVMLGDAVAQVQRVGEKQLVQLGKIQLQLPGLGGVKRPN